MKKIIILLCMLTVTMSTYSTSMTRAQLAEYAKSLKGLKKADLKTAIYNLCQPTKVLSYGSGSSATWSGFVKTDRVGETLECLNRYSTKQFYFTSTTQTTAISGMNIEHSFPKSWWGGTKNNAYKDLFNLYPSDSDANSKKSNYPMGEVTNASILNDYEKVGYGAAGDNGTIQLCEPNDKWKGDFCRSYFYMATIYQNLTWSGDAGLQQLENDTWPTLQEWAYTTYLSWTRNDKVADTEVTRNNAIYDIQSNRNLFIDYPYLAEYVWGDSIDVAFDPYSALTTATDETRYNTKSDSESSTGEYTITKIVNGEQTQETMAAGSAISFDAPTTIPEGWTFVGWTTSPIDGTTDTKPTLVNAATVTGNATYFAVFAKKSSTTGSQTVTTTISNYATSNGWKDATLYETVVLDDNITLTANPSSSATTKYTGQYLSTNNQWCIYQTDGGTLTISAGNNTELESVTFTFNTANSGTLVYGSTTCTSKKAVDLTGTSAEFSVGNSNLKTNGQIKITAISVTYTGGTKYTDYCTTIPATYTEQTLTLKAEDSDGYWATFSNDDDVTFFPASDAVVYGAAISNNKLALDDLEQYEASIDKTSVTGYFVPTGTGVLIYSIDNSVTYYTVDGKTADALDIENMLEPSSIAMTGDYKFYKLAYDDYDQKTGLGFYYGADNGAAFTMPTGLSYLALPTAVAAKVTSLKIAFDDVDGIKEITTINNNNAPSYNLAGQRISPTTKGIHIKNGVKYIIK